MNPEIVENVRKELERLREEELLVVVEGKKDAAALRELGITKIMVLNGPLYEIVERISSTTNEVVLLVDLDTEGKKLYHTLTKDLKAHHVKVDDTLRMLLFKTPVRHIEGLKTFLDHYSGF